MRKKRLCAVLLLCMVFLCACGKAEKKEQAENLEFPGLSWDMTPEAVLKAFQTAKENAVLYDENSLTTSFGITDLEVFGQKAERVFFYFIDYASLCQMPGQQAGEQRLCQIRAYYPQDADLTPVKEKLEQAYGATVSEYYPFSRAVTLENDSSMSLKPLKESESLKYWGTSILGDILPENGLDTFQTYWKNCRSGLNEENWDFFKGHARMVSLIFSDQESEEGKGVEWDAHNLAVYQILNR
ncbi:MAG: hypothetical protein K2N87_03760 [Eubacterium sp.]|nr:hypothetical protein [Eubacterium sp.]